MKPENRQFLEDNLHHWHTLRDAQYLKGLNANERDGMMRVMSEEFQPGYTTDLWCQQCAADMVSLLYRSYEAFLEKEKQQPIPQAEGKVEILDLETGKSEPINVHATFPKNDPAEEKPFPHNLDDIKADGVTPPPAEPKQPKNKKKK